MGTHQWVACGAGRRGGRGRRVVVSKPINVQKDVHGFNYTLPAERGEAEEGGSNFVMSQLIIVLNVEDVWKMNHSG